MLALELLLNREQLSHLPSENLKIKIFSNLSIFNIVGKKNLPGGILL